MSLTTANTIQHSSESRNPAVTHGAVSYYLDRLVTTRVSQHTFVVRYGRPFDPDDPEHIERASTKYKSASGVWCIPNAFHLTGSDIIDMVKLLNSEIFNTATAISDMFERSAKADYEEVVAKRDFLNDYREMAKKYIGERLYTYNCQIDESMALRQPVNPKDWIPLQLALQCVLVGWCLDVAGTIGPVPGDGEALQRCYEKIRVRGKSF